MRAVETGRQSGVGRNPMLVVAVAALAGIALGLAAFTFHYAEGLSYFSTDPKACAKMPISSASCARPSAKIPNSCSTSIAVGT